ncbi:hypothetical protein [Mycobacterium simiae]|uniref:hypothetical protein n=1 Tax=Mycobacterium simiae TaxID=1784 RepID=UPI0013D7BB8E|nr:hypothetical protein [Mycobacterium simiae]
MGIRASKSASALSSGLAVLVMVGVAAGGVGGAQRPSLSAAAAIPTGAISSPSVPGDGGALPVHPVGGGPGCIIGLNCGPINPPKPPPPHRPPTLGHGPQNAAPTPHSP